MIDASQLAREQLREIADASDGAVEVHGEDEFEDGWHCFDISIRFDGLKRDEEGLRIRARESFNILVPGTFPFDHPQVETPHVRFSGFGHVQWRRRLCLYGSSSEWNPEDGMYGFIRRLDAWTRDAALNNLDPADMPLHPPVAYPSVNRLFVPQVDTPLVGGVPWVGWAELREINNRTEIVGWKEEGGKRSAQSALALLLHENLPFEYPRTVDGLLKELESHGIDYGPFILQLSKYARQSDMGTPLAVVLGSPMRRMVPGGCAVQHLAVWEIAAADADRLRQLNLAMTFAKEAERIAAIMAVVSWSESAKVAWCAVREMRPEVTQRRDHSSPVTWFHGKRVAIWGCGAIGTHVAESVVRAGAKTIELVDDQLVAPGLLVRQLFEDADIGKFKAEALSNRLKRIEPEVQTIESTDNLIKVIAASKPMPEADLIIDCTASLAVRTALERNLRDVDRRPPIGSIAIDNQARAAIATLSTREHSGATLDLVRRLKLEACRRPAFSKVLDAFWPTKVRDRGFQPEPGCSEPTFIGSNADLASLSCRMLNSIALSIANLGDGYTAAGWLSEDSGTVHGFKWRADQSLKDQGRGYSVRVSSLAVREMRAWARRSRRTAGASDETGGLVFGELSEAAGVLWVTEVEGPPPDSEAGEDHFTCGIEGMEEAARTRQQRFRGSVDCIGSWHTHPKSSPHPSDVDIGAVAELLAAPGSTRKSCLILILSGDPEAPVLGAHAFRTNLACERFIRIQQSTSATRPLGRQSRTSGKIGLALSGGGSRAIAFHLGCLRALNDLGILTNVKVVSSVSGGSVIAAMYAYSNDSFKEFEERIVELLSSGLQRKILRETFSIASIWKGLRTRVVFVACFVLRVAGRFSHAIVRSSHCSLTGPPPMRVFSRTEAFRNVLAKLPFGEAKMGDVARDSLDTVINATELRTGSAFRFGSKESGCWRFGKIASKEASVADAVAASAAYPVYLPALERKYEFTNADGDTTKATRVLLTDGGIFDNLGVSPLEPGRTPLFSTNVFDIDYILCCDAGAGLFDDDHYPTRWRGRMTRSFSTVFRKAQDATRKRLHQLAVSGDISGFVLCYLGQLDASLPWIPAGIPSRDEVRQYPTNFAAMSTEDIDRLALRGELLMRFLVAFYLPDF